MVWTLNKDAFYTHLIQNGWGWSCWVSKNLNTGKCDHGYYPVANQFKGGYLHVFHMN